MTLFNIDITKNDKATVMTIGFGDPASNTDIVPFVHDRIDQLKADRSLVGGSLLLIDGPASLPVAFVLAHAVGHLFANVAVKDPKVGGFIVATRHGGTHAIGSVIQ